MFTDETGESITLLITFVIVGAVAGGVVGGVVAANNGATGWGIFGGVVAGVLIGAASGALLAAGGTAIVAGIKGMLGLSVNVEIIKKTVALGLAISNLIGVIVSPIMQINWPIVEWTPNRDYNNYPNETPYANISYM